MVNNRRNPWIFLQRIRGRRWDSHLELLRNVVDMLRTYQYRELLQCFFFELSLHVPAGQGSRQRSNKTLGADLARFSSLVPNHGFVVYSSCVDFVCCV